MTWMQSLPSVEEASVRPLTDASRGGQRKVGARQVPERNAIGNAEGARWTAMLRALAAVLLARCL
jgi:hypothetical protein